MSSTAEILFDEAEHSYLVNGRRFPSVTQVLSLLEDLSGIDGNTLEYARERGHAVHVGMALLVRNELEWETLDDELYSYLRGGQRFLIESGVTVIASECRVADESLRLAGTLDLVAHYRNAESVFDFKATAAMPPSVGLQTAAYERLYRATYGGRERRRWCVRLKPNDYQLSEMKDPTDWSYFQSALNCHHWKEAHHGTGRTHAA